MTESCGGVAVHAGRAGQRAGRGSRSGTGNAVAQPRRGTRPIPGYLSASALRTFSVMSMRGLR
jgi:hypothetical protein